MSDTKLDQILKLAEGIRRDKKFERLRFVVPYPKQKEFFNMGSGPRERLLMAPNKVGKTEAGAIELAYHLTGEYPAWWRGKKFERAIRAWAVCETGVMTRNLAQEKLFGPAGLDEDLGSGYVPKRLIKNVSRSHGVADLFDTVYVQHSTNGVEDGMSELVLKSYDQHRRRFQGSRVDVIWMDEEPPDDIFRECLMRITPSTEEPRGGIFYMTFTPIENAGEVVNEYVNNASSDRQIVHMSIEDALHIPPSEYDSIKARIAPHELEARYYGRPGMGKGSVFPIIIDTILEDPIPLNTVPPNWCKLWGIDFGISHPFAAALLAWDKDYDIIHVMHAFKMSGALPINQAFSMNQVAAHVPIAWPHDGVARETSTGDELIKAYKIHLPYILREHATHSDGGFSTETGVMEILTRMMTGRFKVNRNLKEWIQECMGYHRDDQGLILKKNDDIMSATRIAVMMRRAAKPVPLGPGAGGSFRGRDTISNKHLNSDEAISARIDYPLF